MRVLLFFNELSCETNVTPRQADDAMAEFVGLLRKITGWRRDTGLVTAVPLKSLALADGYYMSQWAAAGINRERWRFIRGLQNRAPFSSVLPEVSGAGVDYTYRGRPAEAIGAAHLLDGLVVSLALDPTWDIPWLAAIRYILQESAADDVQLCEEPVRVRNAARPEHADHHEERIKRTGLFNLTSGAGLWHGRSDFFPHLKFLPRVEQDLCGLRGDWLVPVTDLLFDIESAVASWDPTQHTFPAWRSKITPEAERRKRLCEFTDLDGVVRIFDLHARFTPNAGRLHFRLLPQDCGATVAYVGSKREGRS